MTRKYTRMVLDMMEDGVMSSEAIAEMCLSYMSEADVEDMCRANDLVEDEDEGDEFPLSMEYDEGE